MSNAIKGKQAIAAIAALSLGQMLILPSVLAETITRAEARCKLTINKTTAFDGPCTFKHKQRDNKQVFSIDLDNGQSFKMLGTSLDALQVEDYSGLHNVKFAANDSGDKDVFSWSSQGAQNRLVVKLDRQTPANATTSTAPSNTSNQNPDLGTVIGVGLGALLGSLISGGSSSSQPTPSSSNTTSTLPNNPYSKSNYQATAYFKCSVGNPSHNQMCPGGINRKGNGVASITVLFPNRNEVQYDFKNGNVTTNYGGKLDWGKQDDEWYVGIGGNLFIIIPDAAVNGG